MQLQWFQGTIQVTTKDNGGIKMNYKIKEMDKIMEVKFAKKSSKFSWI